MDVTDAVMGYFHYIPGTSLAIMALVNFDFIAIYLATRIHMSKSATYLYILPVIAFAESCGFVYRMACASDPAISKFIIMSLLLITPGNVLSLVNYMTLGKIIKATNAQTDQFYLKPGFVTWFFFSVDIIFFWARKMTEIEPVMIVINVITMTIQAMLFTCFLFIAIYIRQNPDYVLNTKNQPYAKENLISIVIVTSTLQFIRSIYHTCLNATGLAGPIDSSEWAFYMFDVLILALCFSIYSLFFIGDYLPKQVSSRSQYFPVSRFDNLDEDDVDMIPDTNKHIAVFNNVQSVNYSIGSDM